MPAFLTHLLAANDGFSRLESPHKDLLSFNFSTYLWGSIGPDLFFFHNFLGRHSTLGDYGDTMHTYKTEALLAAMGRYVAAKRGGGEHPTLVAYQAGFYSHYQLDSTTHPYIYSQSELFSGLSRDRVGAGSHHRFEADITSALYRLKTGQSVHSFSPKQRMGYNREVAMSVALMLRALLQEVYGIMVPAESIVECFADTLNAQAIIHDPTGFLAGAAASGLDFLRGKAATPYAAHICHEQVHYDVLNQAHREWFRCDDRSMSSHASFVELYDGAVAAATDDLVGVLAASQSGTAYTPPYSLSFVDGKPIDQPL